MQVGQLQRDGHELRDVTPLQGEPGPNAGFTTGTAWLALADDFDPALGWVVELA